MDNRRVAKVYRENSQRVKKLPFPAPSGLLSKVKRYFSGSSLPSRISSLKNGSSGPELGPGKEPSFALPDSFSAANETALAQGSEDLNRILLSFFQEKGSKPLSQVEYEGVMSLLDRSKASVTLPLPELTPEPKKPRVLGENGANSTFAHYSQKVLRNTSGYAPENANNSSVLNSDYRPVYHTFNDVSRSNISMKRVYPFSGVPSPYKTRIKAPDFAARKARRIASAAPLVLLMETAIEASQEPSAFRPKSKTANSLLLILDGNTTTPNDEAEATENLTKSAGKPLHNPYAKTRRFTPLQKDDILENPASPVKADEISKTVSYNKAEELSTKEPAAKEDSLFRNSSKSTKPAEEPAVEEKAETPKPAFSFGASKPSSNLFGLPEASSSNSSDLFGNNVNGSNGDSVLKTSGVSNNKTPAFSFGKPTSPAKPENDDEKPEEKETKSSFQSGAAERDSVPAFSFGTKPKPKDCAEKPAETNPPFSFGAKTNGENPAFSFGSKLNEEKASQPAKPAFNFGQKKENDVETIEVDSEDDKDESEPSKPSLFSFGSKPAPSTSLFGSKSSDKTEPEKPAFTFGAKSSEEKPTPAFNFGAKPAEHKPVAKPTFSFGSKPSDENAASKTPAFSFGAKSDTEKPAINFGVKAAEDKKETEKPVFSFGAKPIDKPAPAFSFGAKSTENETAEKPAFNFGTKPAEDKPGAKPAFSFGANPAEDKPVSNPAFNFGYKPDTEKPVTDKPVTDKPVSKPAFSFGTKSSEETTTAKPTFSFGAKPVEDKPASKPAFGFGAKSDEEKPASKPSFSFGLKSSEVNAVAEPAFSFGSKSTAENGTANKPAFSFGSKPAEDKPSAKPAFSFGAKPSAENPVEEKDTANQPKFSFGSKPAAVKPAGPPAFSFGSKGTEDTPATKPTFNFGGKSTEGTPSTDRAAAFEFGAKPAFSFGKSSESDAKKPALSVEAKPAEDKLTQEKPAFNFGSTKKPSFSFGAKPADEKPVGKKPAFSFGGKAAESKPAFSFGSATGGKSFGFGSNTTDEPTASKPLFSFGSKPVASDEKSFEDKPQTPAFSFGSTPNATPVFSFGGKTNDAKPAISFGTNQSRKTVGSNDLNGKGEDGLSIENEFEFPPAPVQKADFDQEKVKEYEDLFQF